MSQLVSATWINIRSLTSRGTWPVVLMIGIAGAVGVVVTVLSLLGSVSNSVNQTATSNRMIIMTPGVAVEGGSTITRDEYARITGFDGVEKDSNGNLLISAEYFGAAAVTRKSDGVLLSLPIRGVGREAFLLRPELKIVKGRMFVEGVREVIVGAVAAAQYSGLSVGREIQLPDGTWKIVGIFSSGGTAHDSTFITDNVGLMKSYGRESYNSITLKLSSVSNIAELQEFLKATMRSQLIAKTEVSYYAERANDITMTLKYLVTSIAIILAVGTLFSLLNVSYGIIDARLRELATLQAIGFSTESVAGGVLIEILLLSICGATIGSLVARLLFDDSIANFSGLSYPMSVSTLNILIGIGWATCVAGICATISVSRITSNSVATTLKAN